MNIKLKSSEFFIKSREIACKFIQTVVAVDDQMVFGVRPRQEEVYQLIEPDEASGIGSIDTSITSQSQFENHNLYYQALSSAFAAKGIICNGLKPLDEYEETKKVILNSSKNADITILDWQMDADSNDGKLATETIIDILKADLDIKGRLRLIVIYTAANIDEVGILLDEKLKNKSYKCNLKESFITFNQQELLYCKIEIINKSDREEDLIDKIIDSFTKLTAGLLSNAALAAISEIRDKTHNLLYKFNQSLDPAYLSHVLGLISSPAMREQAHEVAFDYAVDLVAEEIKSDLQISQKVKESLSKDVLSKWPEHVARSSDVKFFFKVGSFDTFEIDQERMSRILSIGNKEEFEKILDEEPQFPLDDRLKTIAKTFSTHQIEFSLNSDANDQHLELSAIQCTRRDIHNLKEHIPVLKQGVIVRNRENKKYYICIQPLCDSVRLEEPTNFTFLRISKAGSQEDFTHVIKHNTSTGHLKFNVKASSKDIFMFKFSPNENGKVVKAEKDKNSEYIFMESDTNIQFEWCGELKQPIYQQIVNDVCSSISRVGFDSFEWLRSKKS